MFQRNSNKVYSRVLTKLEKLSMSLEDIIKFDDPLYNKEKDKEVVGDDMTKNIDNWVILSDKEKEKFLDLDLHIYLTKEFVLFSVFV